MRTLLFCLLCLFLTSQTIASTIGNDSIIVLKWLENNKLIQPVGVSWGVPWPKGLVHKKQSFSLENGDQTNISIQSWPLAYWPDGSIKWTGFAAVADPGKGELKLRLSKQPFQPTTQPLKVKENSKDFHINTGILQCVIPKRGNTLIDSLCVGDNVVGYKGQLECLLQDGSDDILQSPSRQKLISTIEKVTIEQVGDVRAVVRVKGTFQSANGRRSFLPFDIRMYFFAGSKSIRFVNTITYNGDEQKDFIKGLGIVFSVPMREQMHNRHVRFSGEDKGIWAEPVRPLVGRQMIFNEGKFVFTNQMAGLPIANLDHFSKRDQDIILSFPVWNDYRLTQNTANGYNIQKRTNTKSAWIDASAGHRASGLTFVGDIKGGLAIGVKDFWQSNPTALEINNAAKDVAELHVWLWSPYSEAMDMRHYDTIAHGLEATYEDVQPGFSTPYGIARTSEFTLFACEAIPSNEVLSNDVQIASHPPLLITTPEYLHQVNTFGVWSLQDRSTPGKKWIEEQLDKSISFYQNQIDERNWYGFWNYGDVMHSYDNVRHTWRYDIGGFAWDNTELGSDLWLWYSFLRTGRADIYRMAEAMTRHTSEVDVYHIGRFAGLGARHNVRHWGDGSKEVRESQASYRRFYYYLSTDERTGDMMHEVAENADLAMTRIDPLREILPKTQYPTHARFGPDWLALIGNWMTEWERTGDAHWRDKIMTGIKSFEKMPYGFFSGAQGAFGYDPSTNKLHQLNDTIGFIALSVLMGGPEVVFELTDLLKEPSFNKLWLQYCTLYGASREETIKAFGKSGSVGKLGNNFSRLPAYLAKTTNDDKSAQLAWQLFLDESSREQYDPKLLTDVNVPKPLQEIPWISTNSTAQWCLNAIELLEFVGDKMPAQHPLWSGGKMPNTRPDRGSFPPVRRSGSTLNNTVEKSQTEMPYKKGALIYQDKFENGLQNWIAEYASIQSSMVTAKDGKLIMDVAGGATVWLNKKISGNLIIEYTRKVLMETGKHDRLSDVNQFWMATDPKNSNLFTRNGTFSQYDSLSLYYVGFGGNTNSTTRFRKYNGKGDRVLMTDLTDKEYLLEANKTYSIKIIVYNGITSFFVDGKKIFSFQDPEPLREGYFGFRTTQSRQEISDFSIYALN